MKCPACSSELKEIRSGDIMIDVCTRGCGGIWFDWQELKKLDEPHELIPEDVVALQASAKAPDKKEIRHCPKCSGSEDVLIRRWFDIKNEVEVDQCLKCSGIWLDVGEIVSIRNQYPTYEERMKAADAYLEGQLHEVKEALDAETMQRMGIDRARYERFKQEGIEPSLLTRIFHSLIGRR